MVTLPRVAVKSGRFGSNAALLGIIEGKEEQDMGVFCIIDGTCTVNYER